MADFDRIKRNVQKMIDQGAPETDIDAYLNSEGTTPRELRGEPSKAYTGKILPFSVDEEGKSHFDSNAGVVGSVKRSVTFPRDVMEGKVDLNSDEAIARGLEMGFNFGPVNPGVRAGDRAIPGPLRATTPRPQIPSQEALRAQGSRQYDQVRDMDVLYRPEAVSNLARDLQAGLNRDGILDVQAPQVHEILGRLQQVPAGENVTAPLSHVESARRALANLSASSPDPQVRMAAGRAAAGLEDFIGRGDPSSLVVRTPSDLQTARDAGRTIGEASGNWGAYRRSDMLTGKEHQADLRASAANSGKNVGNSIRSRLASALINERELRGFNPEETAAVEGVVNGSRSANITRDAANVLGGGGGLGALGAGAAGSAVGAGAGGLVAGPVGAAVGGAVGSVAAPLAGRALKGASNNITRRQLQAADEMVRSRSPLAQQTPPQMNVISPERRALIMRLLEMQALEGGGAPPLNPYES